MGLPLWRAMSPRVELESKTEKDAGPSRAKFETATMALVDLLLSMTLQNGKERRGGEWWGKNYRRIDR